MDPVTFSEDGARVEVGTEINGRQEEFIHSIQYLKVRIWTVILIFV